MTKIKFWKTIIINLCSAIHKANGTGVPQLSTRTIPMDWKNVISCEEEGRPVKVENPLALCMNIAVAYSISGGLQKVTYELKQTRMRHIFR